MQKKLIAVQHTNSQPTVFAQESRKDSIDLPKISDECFQKLGLKLNDPRFKKEKDAIRKIFYRLNFSPEHILKTINNCEKLKKLLLPKDLILYVVAMEKFTHSKNHFNEESYKTLAEAFNGHFLPNGKVIMDAIVRQHTNPVDEVSFFTYLKAELHKHRPFPLTLIFHDLKLVVVGELHNRLRRSDHKCGPIVLDKMRMDLKKWVIDTGFDKLQQKTVEVGDFAKLAFNVTPFMDESHIDDMNFYSRFLTFLFFHDDIGDNKESLDEKSKLEIISNRNDKFKQIMKGRIRVADTCTDKLLVAAQQIKDYITKIISENTDLNYDFFLEEFDKYLDETLSRRQDHIPPFGSDYRKSILLTSSMYLRTSLLAILYRINIQASMFPQQAGEETDFSQTLKYQNLHVSLANDVVSSPREIQIQAHSLVMEKMAVRMHESDIITSDCLLIHKKVKRFYEEMPEKFIAALTDSISETNMMMRYYCAYSDKLSGDESRIDKIVIRPWIYGDGDWQAETRFHPQTIHTEVCLENSLDQYLSEGFQIEYL